MKGKSPKPEQETPKEVPQEVPAEEVPSNPQAEKTVRFSEPSQSNPQKENSEKVVWKERGRAILAELRL